MLLSQLMTLVKQRDQLVQIEDTEVQRRYTFYTFGADAKAAQEKNSNCSFLCSPFLISINNYFFVFMALSKV